MKGFKFQPVKWMTGILAVLGVLVTIDQTIDVIPDREMAYVTGAITVITVVLGYLTHQRTTATANPKTTIDGTLVPLVPKPSAIPADATSSVPDPQR